MYRVCRQSESDTYFWWCPAVAEEMGDGHTQIMKILFKKCEILTILKTMFPVQENVNILYFGNVNINQLYWDWFQDFVY
jgi:hypothetical protein